MTIGIGSYCLVRQKNPKGGYLPCWAVQKRLPGVGKHGGSLLTMESGRKLLLDDARICPLCLEVPPGESPTEQRPDCKCQRPLRRFLDKWMEEWRKARSRAIQEGQLEELRQVARRKGDDLIWPAAQLYLQRGPETAGKAVQQLRLLVEEGSGVPLEAARWGVLTANLFIDWAEMRQEHFRRGWSKRDAAPDDAWPRLRAEQKARKLPPLDTRTVMECNTTINTYVRSVKAMLGLASRTKYLRGLEIPDLDEVRELSLSLPAPKGHKAINEDVFRVIWEALGELKAVDLRLWVVLNLLLRLSLRPIEVAAAQTGWLARVNGVDVLAVHNRPDEEFQVKAGEADPERYLELTPELLAAIKVVAIPGGSLIGARHKTEAENLVRRQASKWIREYVGDATKFTNYLFRHRGGAARYTVDGKEAAAAGLGHAPGSSATGRYVAFRKVVRALTDEELAGGGA